MYNRAFSSILLYQGLLLATLTTLHHIQSADFPCQSRPGDPGQGHVCVCNSTYCDTIGRPDQLAPRHYYHYTTSNYTPGFTQTMGTFSNFTKDSDYVFTINSSVVSQEFLGFGGASTDSAGMVLQTLPQEAQDKLMESYFGTTGIEYTFLRVPIGSTDFSIRHYTLDNSSFDEHLEHFSLQDEDINYKIPLIKKAMTLSDHDVKVIATTWYAPEWMKAPNSVCGYILDEYQSSYAAYHIKFIQAYKEAGIDTWAITAGNEPLVIIMYQEYCHDFYFTLMTPQSERVLLKDHLYPQLSAANLSNVLFLALDDMRPFVPHWMSQLAEDPEVIDKVAGVAIHWYFDWYSDPNILDDLHRQYPDKLIMYTEGSINFKIGDNAVLLGSWDEAEIYSHYIMELLNHWGQGFIDWNLMLNLDGGPTKFSGIDAPVIVNSTSGEFYKQPMVYVMGHFSKFIQPGSKRVQMISSNSSSTEEKERSFKKSGVEFKKPVPFVIPPIPEVVEGVATVNPDGSQTIIISNTRNVTAKVTVEDVNIGFIYLLLDPHSINTILYWPK